MPTHSAQSAFAATQWSIVLAAAGDESGASVALGKLCAAYWYPLYAFARRTGLSSHDAEDAAQGFFHGLIARSGLSTVSPEHGRFRSFLLAGLKNHLSHERERATAAKRGGGQPAIAFDALDAEQRYALEPADTLSPDQLYDRRWAHTILEQAQTRLADEYAGEGKAALHAALCPALAGSRVALDYAALSTQLGSSEGALRVAAHRLRDRYRAILRAEVAQTVADSAAVDAELRHLISCL